MLAAFRKHLSAPGLLKTLRSCFLYRRGCPVEVFPQQALPALGVQAVGLQGLKIELRLAA
jgi:hypothetical protein